jgi:hypothetical protein
MSRDSSSSASTQEPGIRPSFIYNGTPLWPEDMSMFKRALSFVEDRLNEKPQSDVHLCKLNVGFSVTWHDGTGWMKASILPSSTTTERVSLNSEELGEAW